MSEALKQIKTIQQPNANSKKNDIFYSHSTIMGFAKQILWLSAGSIALLLNTDLDLYNKDEITLYFMSIFSFVFVIIFILRVYKLNLLILYALIQEDTKKEAEANKKIEYWDCLIVVLMIVGVLSTIIFFILNKGINL